MCCWRSFKSGSFLFDIVAFILLFFSTSAFCLYDLYTISPFSKHFKRLSVTCLSKPSFVRKWWSGTEVTAVTEHWFCCSLTKLKSFSTFWLKVTWRVLFNAWWRWYSVCVNELLVVTWFSRFVMQSISWKKIKLYHRTSISCSSNNKVTSRSFWYLLDSLFILHVISNSTEPVRRVLKNP